MKEQHLSDEAVAAFADGVLRGLARDRATRHIEKCRECRAAVKVQREAAWALRTAPAPALPVELFERLQSVPQTTPIAPAPTVIGPDGSTMLSTMAPMAAFVPPKRSFRKAAR
jgi:anti-sigma factor RsiW